MSDTTLITMRLSPDLATWAIQYGQELGADRSTLVRELLEAARQRRLVILDAPIPFVINDGSDPAYPVLVCHNPK